MIELAVAAFQPAGPAQVSVALSPSPEVARSPDGRSLCTDKLMARFEAFDLAGGPLECRGTTGLTLTALHDEGERAEAAGLVPANETPKTSPADGDAWGREVVHGMALLPAVAVAALLIRKSKWRRRCLPLSAGLLKALQRRIGQSADVTGSAALRTSLRAVRLSTPAHS
jgi:hypothetical protein